MATVTNTFVLKLQDQDFEKGLKEAAKLSEKSNKEIADSLVRQSNLKLKLSKQQTDLAKATSSASRKELADRRKNIASTKQLIAAETSRQQGIRLAALSQDKQSKALNRNTIAKKKNETATSNLANQTIRYLRWAGTIVGVAYAVNRAWSATLGIGLEVNKMMEDNTSGIAALLSANTQMVLANGEVVNSYEKFKIGQEIATKTMDDLRKASIKTYATFPQLTEIFQQSIGHTLGMGKAFGTTTDEIIQNTIKFTQSMSNIGGSVGMEMRKVQEEVRSLLSGNVSTDSLLAVMLFGSPTEANKALKLAKKRGDRGVSDMLNGMMEAFEPLKDVTSYTRSLLELEDAWSQTMQQLAEPVFEDLKVAFKDLAQTINDNKDDISNTFEALYDGMKDFSTEGAEAFKTLYEAIKILQEAFVDFEDIAVGLGMATSIVFSGISNSALIAENAAIGIQSLKNLVMMSSEEYAEYEKAANKKVEANRNLIVSYDELLEKVKKAGLSMREVFDPKPKTEVQTEIDVASKLLTKTKVDNKYILERIKETQKAKAKTVQLNEKITKDEEVISSVLKKRIQLEIILAGWKKTDNTKEIKNAQILLDSNIEKEKALRHAKQVTTKEIAKINLTAKQKETEAINKMLVAEQTMMGVEVKKSDMSKWKLEALKKELILIDNQVEKNKKLAEIYSEIYTFDQAISVEKKQSIDESYESQLRILDLQIDLANSAKDWQNGLEGVAAALGGVSTSFSKMHVNNLNYEKAQAKLDKQHKKDLVGVQKFSREHWEIENKHEEDSAALKQINLQNELAAYGSLAGAMSQMFKEGSEEAKVALIAQQALALASGVTAVMQAASAPPPAGFAMAAAMAGVVASTLGIAGIAFGGGGGKSSATIAQEQREDIEISNKPILDRLDRQIELLEALGGFGGTAIGAEVSLAGSQFQKSMDIAFVDAFEVMGDTMLIQPLISSFERYTGLNVSEDFEGLAAFYEFFGKHTGITAEEWAIIENDFQQVTHDYTMSLLEQVQVLSSAADGFEGAFDAITGTDFYKELNLQNAQDAVNELLEGTGLGLDEYLKTQIENIREINDTLSQENIALLLSDDINNLAEQQKLLSEISADTTEALNEGALEALNNKDAILLVADSMGTLNDTFVESADIQAEIAKKINEEMLGSLSYLSDIEKLSYANNLYRDAITPEDRVSSSRTITEISRGTTRTREEYAPIFLRYLNEVKKQAAEATTQDVVNGLDKVVEEIIISRESATKDSIYASQ